MARERHPVIGDLASQRTEVVHRDEILLTEQLEGRKRHERTAADLRLIWEQRRRLSRIIAWGLAASLLIAFLIPARYESTCQLMPPDQSGNMGILTALLGKTGASEGGSGGLAGLAGDVLGLKTSGDLFVGVLGSRTVQDDLVRKFDLRKTYHVRSWKSARDTLKDSTSVTSDRKSGIITIKVTDRNPQRAAELAQEYVAELNQVVTNMNTSSAHRERVFLEGRLAEVKQDLEAAEKDFSEFASKNAAINVPEQGKAMIAAAAGLEGQLIAAQTELESLKQVYTDSNVRVREAQARVDELRRQIGRVGGRPGSQATPVGGDSDSVYPSIRQLPVLGVTYADLYRRTKVEEAVFESLTQEYELAKVQEAKETPSVKVLDPPDVPEKKSFPPRLLIGLIGMLVAGIFGIIWIRGRKNWERVDALDARKLLAQEIVGGVRHTLSRSRNRFTKSSISGPTSEQCQADNGSGTSGTDDD